MNSQIIATGSYLPPNVVLNEALTQFPAARLPMIEEKTGIKARRHADAATCTSDLGLLAAKQCLERAGLQPGSIDGIVLATSSPDRIQPATATRVQHLLGASKAFAFDVNSVCSGALFALNVGDAMISAGMAKRILVVAAEMYSKFLNPQDFSTFPYFGDGAGAVLLQASQSAGIRRTLLRSDGAGSEVIQIPGGGTMLPFSAMSSPAQAYFAMSGREVFDFASRRGPEIVLELLDQASVPLSDIAWIVTHQANISIIETIAAQLNTGLERFWVNLDRYGNTAAASVFIGLDELNSCGKLNSGQKVVLVAFGGGLSWAASLIEF
jgi:3-oxoacyl-[acyl-carrier-protein] synthase-3